MALDLIYFSGGARERVLQAILSAGHRVTDIFINDPERWPKVKPTIELAEMHSIPVHVVKSKAEILDILPAISGRNCLSVGFNYLFPRHVLEKVRIFLNVHGSLLPKYPGARTLAWAIANGESESGVTVHLVDEGMDTGPILLQRVFALSRFDTTRSLSRKTSLFEPQVVIDALARYEELGEDAFSIQEETTVAPPNRVPGHSRLDANLSLGALFNHIRAADPDNYPAHFFVDGEKVCIRLWRPEKPANEEDLI
jgi:methionyl-tRNA formyltransferase